MVNLAGEMGTGRAMPLQGDTGSFLWAGSMLLEPQSLPCPPACSQHMWP